MVEVDVRCLVDHDPLGLAIELFPFFLVVDGSRLADEPIHLLILVKGAVSGQPEILLESNQLFPEGGPPNRRQMKKGRIMVWGGVGK